MTLAEDIVDWINDDRRPSWQKAIFARLCGNDAVTEDDIMCIVDSLIAEGPQTRAFELKVDDIPGSTQSGGETVQLLELKDVKAINALLEGQRLTFAPDGLTIIYGDNGSGKSGYARLIRKAVTAKAPLEEVLRNVFVESDSAQGATYVYSHGGTLQEWLLGADRSRHLSSIRFFDEECGDSYITQASVVNYRPSALSLLDQLVTVCEQVQFELAGRITRLEAQRPALPSLPENTEAHEFMRTLSADTTGEQLRDASELTDKNRETLAQRQNEYTRLRASDPAREKTRLRQLRIHWESVLADLNALHGLISKEAIEDLKFEKQRAEDKRGAANLASTQNFKDEPLPQVGSEAWRALWEAAREFSTADAYHEHTYPYAEDDARCVLCQQELSLSAAERLQKFERFVTDTTAREAAKAEERVSFKRNALNNHRSLKEGVTRSLAALEASKEPIEDIAAWLTLATSAVETAADWLVGSAEKLSGPIDPPDIASVRKRIEQLQTDEDSIDEDSFKAQIHDLQAQIDPLQARLDLVRTREAVIQEVERLKRLKRLEEAQKYARTNGITKKRTELSSSYVTGHVQRMFIRECEFLDLDKVTYAPARGRKNVALEHQPALQGTIAKAPVNKVLSEGEQTALGLAGFLTEVELDPSQSAVVFDDPVSSLDAQRRGRVAARLVELAKSRQVVVFTHEATFVHMLNKESEEAGIHPARRSVMRMGGRPGDVTDRHPWKVQDVRQRLGELSEGLDGIQRDFSTLDDEEYAERTSKWGGRLSQLWERTVITDIAYRVVEGGTAEFKPKQFKIIPRVTADDEIDFEAGYSKASWWASRHDQAPERNWQPPSFAEMQTELERVKGWADRLKKYRNQ